MSMGGAGSKPEDVAKIATMKVDYSPPLGPPNPVRNSMYVSRDISILIFKVPVRWVMTN